MERPEAHHEEAQDQVKERPRKALSAYNLFFRDERQKILSEIPSPKGLSAKRKQIPTGKRISHGKIGFAELARKIASRWNSIDPETKKYYERLAAEDKTRFAEELEMATAINISARWCQETCDRVAA